MLKIKDFFEGVYSGIPLCCVLSYCNGRNGIKAAQEYGKDYYKDYSANYVQCRRCEKNNKIVKIKNNGRLFNG